MASSTMRPMPIPVPGGTASASPLASHPHAPAAGAVRETHSLKLHTHTSGRRMVNQYLVLSELGRGVHGRVRKATDTSTDQPVAIKIVDRATRPRLRSALVPASRAHAPTATDDKVLREIAILKQCASDHVVRLLEVIDDPLSKKLFLVLEYMSGGEVQWRDSLARPLLSVDTVRHIARDVICGLQYLHYNGIIHRDIKPANLLWDETHTHVKISDFGVSHFSLPLFRRGRGLALDDQDGEEAALYPHSRLLAARSGEESDAELEARDQAELARTTGSPAFFAPELCLSGERPLSTAQCQELGTAPPEGQPPPPVPPTRVGRVITQSIDIWAFGVTLYCLLFGSLPFNAPTEFALFSVIPWSDYALPCAMGSDQVRVGPRAQRWDAGRLQATVHDQEMSSSVSRFFQADGTNSMMLPSASSTLPFDSQAAEPDFPFEELGSDARALRELLDGTLEKDPDARSPLDKVKASPWTTRGLSNPQAWLDATDPELGPYVPVYYTDVPDAAAANKIKKPRSAGLISLSFGKHYNSSLPSDTGRSTPLGTWRRTESQGTSNLGKRMRSGVNRVRARMQRRDSASTPSDAPAVRPAPGRNASPPPALVTQTIGPSGPRQNPKGGHRFASLPLSHPSSERTSNGTRTPIAQLFTQPRPSSALSAPLDAEIAAKGMQWHASEPVSRETGRNPPEVPARPASALNMDDRRSVPGPVPAGSQMQRRATVQPQLSSPADPDVTAEASSTHLIAPSTASAVDTLTSTAQTTPSTSGQGALRSSKQRNLPSLLPSRFKLRRQKSSTSLRSRMSAGHGGSTVDLPQAPPSSYGRSSSVASNPHDTHPYFIRSSRRSVTTGHRSHPSAGSIGSSSVGLPSIHDMPCYPRTQDSVDETKVLDYAGARTTVDSPAPSLAAAGQVMSRSYTPTLSRTTSGTPHGDNDGDRPGSPTTSLRSRLQRFTLHRRQRSQTNTTNSLGNVSRPNSALSQSPALHDLQGHISPLDMARSPGSNHTVPTASSQSAHMAHTSSGVSYRESALRRSVSGQHSMLSSAANEEAASEEDLGLSDDELDADLHAAANTGFWHNDGSGWKFVGPDGNNAPAPPLAARNADPLAHLVPFDPGLEPGTDGVAMAPEDLQSSPTNSVEGGYNLYKHVDWDHVRSRTPPSAMAAVATALAQGHVGPQGHLTPVFPPQSYVSPSRPRRPTSQITVQSKSRRLSTDVDPHNVPLPGPEDETFDTSWGTQRPSMDDGRFSDADEEVTHQWEEPEQTSPSLSSAQVLSPTGLAATHRTPPSTTYPICSPASQNPQLSPAYLSAFAQARKDSLPCDSPPLPATGSGDGTVNMSSIGVDSAIARVIRYPEMISTDSYASSVYPPSDEVHPRASTPRG